MPDWIELHPRLLHSWFEALEANLGKAIADVRRVPKTTPVGASTVADRTRAGQSRFILAHSGLDKIDKPGV